MLTQKQRSDMRDGIPAMGESTARVWVRELLDHAEEVEQKADGLAVMVGNAETLNYALLKDNGRLKAENAALREVVTMARRFAAYAQVLEVLAAEDRKRTGSTNGWDNLDPILGAKGQLLTLGDFRLLRDALARADALTGEKPVKENQ